MGSRGLFRFLTIAVVLLPALAVAQGTGTIRGRVTDAGTGAPLPNVQIRIDGTTLGGQSGSNGEYAITGVPGGTQSISARRVGYAPQR